MDTKDGLASGDGPRLYDRRLGIQVVETVLGDRWLRAAYSEPWRSLCSLTLFRTAFASRLMGMYADSRLSRSRIAGTIEQLGIDPGEFRDPVENFRTFNQFFCRHLRPDARPFCAASGTLVSPADCRLLVFPHIDQGTCVPVKGASFTIEGLLGPGHESEAQAYRGGALAICRLCPADYHRYHYPASGHEVSHWVVPGRYHSVHPLVLALGLNVFAENRREVTLLELAGFGSCAFLEVGAFGVAGIVQTHERGNFAKMDEKGYFTFGGSTLIMLFRPDSVCFDQDLCDHSARGMETRVLCGDTLGSRPN